VFAVRQQVLLNIPSPGSGGVVGRMKIGENTSPLPRDRIFLNYSYFDNVPLTRGGVNVNRFSPGFEKTFFQGMASVDIRFPFASTLNTGMTAGGISDTSHMEFGNITVALKTLFEATETWAVSGGMAIAFPTGDDVNVGLADGTDLIRIENESVHLMPFLGLLVTPNERFFAQAFLQFDFDANGNPVLINDFVNGLQPVGDVNDASFLYADLSLGYLLFYRPYDDGFLRSFSPLLEMHYNRSLQKTDVIRSGLFQVGRVAGNIEILNAVVGGRFEFQNDKSLTLAYAIPLGGGADQQFDGELRVIFNWLFGASKHE